MLLAKSEVHIDEAIQILEEELKPHSELAYILDKSKNYHLSMKHHKSCIELIESIMKLKSKKKVEYTYDFTKSLFT